jgi:hypothetical protein
MVRKPFRRTVRQLSDGSYANDGNGFYVLDGRYASDVQHFLRAYEYITAALRDIFESVEPAEQNLSTYSFKLYELLIRICTEIEANFKAIFRDNGFVCAEYNMHQYKRIEKSHFLSQYKVKYLIWEGGRNHFSPFSAWEGGRSPFWYLSYNQVKHDRHTNFNAASFENVLGAYAGLSALIFSQFRNQSFNSPITIGARLMPKSDHYEQAIGRLVAILPPPDVPIDERYDFRWSELSLESEAFQCFDYAAD